MAPSTLFKASLFRHSSSAASHAWHVGCWLGTMPTPLELSFTSSTWLGKQKGFCRGRGRLRLRCSESSKIAAFPNSYYYFLPNLIKLMANLANFCFRLSPKDLECAACMVEFNLETTRPRALFPCGHRICWACLKVVCRIKPSRCPYCRSHFTADSDDWHLIQALHKLKEKKERKRGKNRKRNKKRNALKKQARQERKHIATEKANLKTKVNFQINQSQKNKKSW